MPTGFTAGVADGEITSLRQFVLLCARGMGALITMRDEPFDAPLPECLEPNTRYEDEKLAALRAALSELTALTNEEIAQRQAEDIRKALEYRDKYLAEKAAQRQRYEAMVAQVSAWSTDAEGLREFMLEQLASSIKFDCGSGYEPEIPAEQPAGEWRAAERQRLAKAIGRAEGQRTDEIARTAERNRWLKALRDSLPADETEAA